MVDKTENNFANPVNQQLCDLHNHFLTDASRGIGKNADRRWAVMKVVVSRKEAQEDGVSGYRNGFSRKEARENAKRKMDLDCAGFAILLFRLFFAFLRQKVSLSGFFKPPLHLCARPSSTPKVPLFFAFLRDLCDFAVTPPIQETTKRTKLHEIEEAD